MKTIIILSLILFGTGCNNSGGSSSSSSPATPICTDAQLDNTWYSNWPGELDTMVIASSCAVTSSYCGSQSTLSILSLTTTCDYGATHCGTVGVTTTSTNGSNGCLPMGYATCDFLTDGSAMAFTCGHDVIQFSTTQP